jgi:hypothetical protein
MAVLGINREKRVFYDACSYTSNLSALVKIAQLAVREWMQPTVQTVDWRSFYAGQSAESDLTVEIVVTHA